MSGPAGMSDLVTVRNPCSYTSAEGAGPLVGVVLGPFGSGSARVAFPHKSTDLRGPMDVRHYGLTMEAHLLTVGDRVTVYGGYDTDPEWLADSASGYKGTVVEFIPGQNDGLAAVVELDAELVLPDGAGAVKGMEVRGRFLVLELGHVGTTWATPTPRIHVELCADAPPPARWQDRPKGVWVESHATYCIAG